MGYFDEVIAHHGILGQKWGLRRFQNKDGSLTAKGRARMNDVANSKLKSKIDTSNARFVYKRNARLAGSMSTAEASKSVKLEKKASKYAKGTDKYNELMKESKDAADRSKKFSKVSNLATQKVRDLDEGKIKAGRDFIVQRDVNINITKIPAYLATFDEASNPKLGEAHVMSLFGVNDYKVIEKNKSNKQKDSAAIDTNKSSSKPTAVMVTKSEAKKLGLDDSTRFTPEEEAEFWKAYAKQFG